MYIHPPSANEYDPNQELRKLWTKTVVQMVAIVAYMWAVCFFVYYGLQMSTNEFYGDRFINYLIFRFNHSN